MVNVSPISTPVVPTVYTRLYDLSIAGLSRAGITLIVKVQCRQNPSDCTILLYRLQYALLVTLGFLL